MQNGREEGLQQGLQQGLQEGLQQGLIQGEERGKIKAFYELGFDIKEIAKKTNKPEEEIITIIRS